MTKIVLLSLAAAFAGSLSLAAQTGGTPGKPLNEKELLNTIDSLGEGDPATKAPLGVGDYPSADSARGSKKSEAKKRQGPEGATEITAQEASFDQKANQAVFAGDVKVNNPEFKISCDKLTAFLSDEKGKNKTPSGGSGVMGKPAAAPAAPAPAAEKKGGSGGLKKVIAEGDVVITQEKVNAEGKASQSIGRGDRGVYDSATGDITLTGNPSIQQGINTIIATDPGTVMILNREGRLKVIGAHKTVIQETPENPTASNGR